ncbi:hypothetical protein [Jatrophihabitans sp.]|uniref:hypothetical protein n=1 Tax=Jatrophihabitans sp. TaxID=1932789 RepID=UPI0030C6935D|nr:hypothetical protein [Jatrophihabitans sp.]
MGPRDFDPVALAQAERDGWVGYYRRDWRGVLAAAVRMVRLGFGMSWPRTLRGAWFVLRANQLWAPYPENDPVAARDYMRRFYALVARDGEMSLDPAKAARLEVEWWRVHRLHQRDGQLVEGDLCQALVELYSYVYRVDPVDVTPAAEHRVRAMRHSDEWVLAGCDLDDPLLADELAELVASYSSLLKAVQR